MSGFSSRSVFRCLAIFALSAAAVHGAPSDDLLAVNRVRFLPAPKHEKAMVGGTICVSNVSATDGFVVVATIKDVPEAGKWTELSFDNSKPYRWIKYQAPDGSSGWISKIEFYAGKEKLTGQSFAPYPSGTFRRVVDSRPPTSIHGVKPDGQYVGIDIEDKASSPHPIFSPRGDEMTKPVTVIIRCRNPKAIIRYTTDGTEPTEEHGQVYSSPISIDNTTTLTAVAFCDGLAPSPVSDMEYLYSPIIHRNSLHFGNSLTGNAISGLSLRLRTAGIVHQVNNFGMGGGLTKVLWNVATIGVGDPTDKTRWHKLFTNTNSLAGEGSYTLDAVQKAADEWQKLWPSVKDISDVTFQPRDGNVAEEADYTERWLKVVREKFPQVQPWLYVEWTESDRHRLTDKGLLPSSEMSKVFPALTWEESMSAMLLYGEEVQLELSKIDHEGKHARIIPSGIALGWIHHQIVEGKFPGIAPDAFEPALFADGVHLNPQGCFLLQCTWYSALYGQSPEGKFLPLKTTLTAEQATAMQRLAWDVVKNYPDCGLYEQGTTPLEMPAFSPAPSDIKDATQVTISSATPGAWFRYTLDGTEPTRTRGYVYCGVVSVRPGMKLKAIAYKSGMADSPVSQAKYGTISARP